MAKKVEEKKMEICAVMTGHGDGSIVKVWQFYSIFNFCRSYGASKDEAGSVARWCQKAEAGESRKGEGYLIRIMELKGGCLS